MSRIPNAAGAGARRLTKAERAIQDMRRIGAGPWVYVGDPGDPFITYWSPPFENSFAAVAGRPIRFRHGLDGLLEFEGAYDLTAGAVTGTVAFTLPPEWLGETFDEKFPIQLTATTWTMGVHSVDGDTGEVTVYWPIQADAIA